MANPLRWFRRHAKILMVVLGSAAMAIFGLGPVFDTLSRPSQHRDREVEIVAKWNGGDITRTELDAMQIRYFQTQRFLEALRNQAIEVKGDEFQSWAQPIPTLQIGQKFQQSLVDQQLIERMMLAQKAEEEGIVVSDGVIDDYLTLASGEVGFSRNDLVQINKAANQNGCSLENVRRHLQIELLAMQMRLYSGAGLPSIPNAAESMQLYARATERIECQALPISVEQYVSKIEEQPSKSELMKIYEAGKYDYSDPTGKQPGFKRPEKVKVQYLVGEMETFIQNEMNKLTDEEVQKEYDRLVKESSDLVMEAIPDEMDESIKINDPPPSLEDENKTDDSSGDPEKSDDDNVAPPPSLTEPENSGSDSTGEEESKQKADDDSDSKSDEQTDPEQKKDSNDQSINNIIDSEFQFVSLRQDDTTKTGDSNQETETKGDASKAAQSETEETANDSAAGSNQPDGDQEKAADQTAADQTAADPTATDPKAADSESEKTDTPSTTVPAPGQSTSVQPLLDDQQTEIKKRPRPLKDVADVVKRSMVEADARKAMEEAINKATARLMVYYTLRMKWEYKKEKDRGEPPTPLDYKAIAKEYNLALNETSLVSVVELAEDPVGRIIVPVSFRQPGFQPQTQYRMIAEMIFERFDSIKEFDTQDAPDLMTGNQYLYWLSDKVEAKVPEFDVCEPEVLKFWKEKKALELATAEAEKIVAKVNSEGKLLSEMYGEKAFETGQFSWFNNIRTATIGNPADVKNPGDEFMDAVFSIEDKRKAVVAPNQGKDTLYVVQLTSDRKTSNEMGNEYLEDNYFRTKSIPPQVQNVANRYRQELGYEWYRQFADSMGLKFVGR